MTLDSKAVLQMFLAETAECIQTLEAGLLRLEKSPSDALSIQSVFRAAHTVKGAAATVGFTAIAELAHALEDVLDAVRRGSLEVSGHCVTILLQTVDGLRRLLADAGAGRDSLGEAELALIARLQAECQGTEEQGASGTLDASTRAGDGPGREASFAQSTLRVDVSRLDELLRLVGEITVERDRLGHLLAVDTPRRTLVEAHREAERLFRELHARVMSLRMVPVGPTFRQLARVVRDLSRSLGKQAELTIEGDEVEVDNSILQMLKDPLMHMVRNALDHAIERPAERLAKRKPATGRIHLRSRQEAGGVMIELEDDGAGLDRPRILERGRALGIVSAGVTPSDAQIDQLVFEPGFSTAAEVTTVSGRGVGLDVVRRNIEALRGSVGITTEAGRGTRMTIRLPLTLAVIEGLLAFVGEETYVIPAATVAETLALPGDEPSSGGGGVIDLRGEALPYMRLRHRFDMPGTPPSRELVVVVQVRGGSAGLVVDGVRGQTQVVIRPLPRVFDSAPGVSATAVLADGRAALILDVQELLEEQGSRIEAVTPLLV